MKALILAAGDGTRMRPLTAKTPKPLLLVGGRPFIEHAIGVLKGMGIEEILMLVGWKKGRIIEYLGDGSRYGVSIRYIEQKERLGTAHAVGCAKQEMDGDFLCLNGDVVISEEVVSDLMDFSKGRGGSVVTRSEVENPSGFGIVEVEDDRVVAITEKPKSWSSPFINSGIYLFSKRIFEAIEDTPRSPRGEYEITDSIMRLAKMEDVWGFTSKEPWLDLGRPWDMLTANEIFLSSLKEDISGEIEECVHIKGQVKVGKGTVVRSGSYIIGPVVIGEHCNIGPNCYIRPATTIGNGCHIGAASEVKNSIVMHNSNVPHHNYVGDSIIGSGCNLGSGTKVANLRLDNGNIKSAVRGVRRDTGRRKLGVIMGDNVKTGINCCINVGTTIGEDCVIGPGALVSKDLAPRTRIY